MKCRALFTFLSLALPLTVNAKLCGDDVGGQDVPCACGDVVVSDLAMPTRDGYALLRALRGRGLARGLVTVALTAHARQEDRERALAAGFDAYVTKPVEPSALAALVRELVERRRRPA